MKLYREQGAERFARAILGGRTLLHTEDRDRKINEQGCSELNAEWLEEVTQGPGEAPLQGALREIFGDHGQAERSLANRARIVRRGRQADGWLE